MEGHCRRTVPARFFSRIVEISGRVTAHALLNVLNRRGITDVQFFAPVTHIPCSLLYCPSDVMCSLTNEDTLKEE